MTLGFRAHPSADPRKKPQEVPWIGAIGSSPSPLLFIHLLHPIPSSLRANLVPRDRAFNTFPRPSLPAPLALLLIPHPLQQHPPCPLDADARVTCIADGVPCSPFPLPSRPLLQPGSLENEIPIFEVISQPNAGVSSQTTGCRKKHINSLLFCTPWIA